MLNLIRYIYFFHFLFYFYGKKKLIKLKTEKGPNQKRSNHNISVSPLQIAKIELNGNFEILNQMKPNPPLVLNALCSNLLFSNYVLHPQLSWFQISEYVEIFEFENCNCIRFDSEISKWKLETLFRKDSVKWKLETLFQILSFGKNTLSTNLGFL